MNDKVLRASDRATHSLGGSAGFSGRIISIDTTQLLTANSFRETVTRTSAGYVKVTKNWEHVIAEQLVAAILGAAIAGPASGGISAVRSQAAQKLEAQLASEAQQALRLKQAALAAERLELQVGAGAAHPDEFLRVISNIDKMKGLVRHAESAGSRVQASLDHLVKELGKGNLDPGIGTSNLKGSIYYARARDGARVFFVRRPGVVEIIAKADKSNEDAVINMILKNYDALVK
jgi:hypothetical protein